jgi:hypothetical protein
VKPEARCSVHVKKLNQYKGEERERERQKERPGERERER